MESQAQCIVGYNNSHSVLFCILPILGKVVASIERHTMHNVHTFYSKYSKNSLVVCFSEHSHSLKAGSPMTEEICKETAQIKSQHFLFKPGKQLDLFFLQHTMREYWADLCCVWVPLTARGSKALYYIECVKFEWACETSSCFVLFNSVRLKSTENKKDVCLTFLSFTVFH